jgi:hypothetical protein
MYCATRARSTHAANSCRAALESAASGETRGAALGTRRNAAGGSHALRSPCHPRPDGTLLRDRQRAVTSPRPPDTQQRARKGGHRAALRTLQRVCLARTMRERELHSHARMGWVGLDRWRSCPAHMRAGWESFWAFHAGIALPTNAAAKAPETGRPRMTFGGPQIPNSV